MGKILVIKGADFSAVAVDKLTPGGIDEYVQSKYYQQGTDYSKVLVDADSRILYGVKTNGDIVDNSSLVSGTTLSDGTLVTTIINRYK